LLPAGDESETVAAAISVKPTVTSSEVVAVRLSDIVTLVQELSFLHDVWLPKFWEPLTPSEKLTCRIAAGVNRVLTSNNSRQMVTVQAGPIEDPTVIDATLVGLADLDRVLEESDGTYHSRSKAFASALTATFAVEALAMSLQANH
jgi:hypothetical protein